MTAPEAAYCTSCGATSAEIEGGDPPVSHARCEQRRAYEPPRFCARCGRRMVVQVTPLAWTATCSQHGRITSG